LVALALGAGCVAARSAFFEAFSRSFCRRLSSLVRA
jgi:hypothetical protein